LVASQPASRTAASQPASRTAASRPADRTATSQLAGRTIDEVLASARSRLGRLSPRQASAAAADGAVLVDIRPAAQRAAEGEIPGSLVVERNVLEWRFDPASSARLPQASHDLQVIIFCSEGYTSSLAAAALQELGVHRATDLAGGFLAWRRAGLPVARAGHSSES
jgi:rhodanese-related sulfurtransferase